MKYYKEEEEIQQPQLEQEYCDFCWDKRKKVSKELFFLDRANNLRLCLFCPNCGRPYEDEA